MYLGSDFHRFWARSGNLNVHPDDKQKLDETRFLGDVLPCPFDGPLDRAKVVVCLANPWYPDTRDPTSLNELIMSMRSGEEPLPDAFEHFYRRIFGPIGIPVDKLRDVAAIFNACPYASETMEDGAVKNALGLESVWQAQKFLREVLIPRARNGNIYLIFIRALRLWGVNEKEPTIGTLRVVRNRAINGVMPEKLGQEIKDWLLNKYPSFS